MGNIQSDTDAIYYLADYVYTFGSARGWPGDIQSALSQEIIDRGTAGIDEYCDSLEVVMEYSQMGLPDYSGFVSVAEAIAEQLGIEREGWADWISGYVQGVASDVADIATTTRDIASGVGSSTAAAAQSGRDNPWFVPAVVGGIVAIIAIAKRWI